MHKVFISYHHEKNQEHKEKLLEINKKYSIFIDRSVDTGDISENLSDEEIRQEIRDKYLRDSTVTILLVGTETKNRKHIDWELYSSMYDGKVNKQSGILVINLPMVANYYSIMAEHGEQNIYPEIPNWTFFTTRKEYENRCPYMPERIIDNYKAGISVTNWDKIADPNILKYLIDITFKDRMSCNYNLSRQMRRQNFNPLSPTL